MDSHGLLLAKAAGRALVLAIAVGSLVVLLDASANYSGLGWRTAARVREPSELEREASATGVMPPAFRLSANLPLKHARAACRGAQRAPASADGDESFDSSCSGGATVNAVGDLPRAELVSLPGDWLYHRALHF